MLWESITGGAEFTLKDKGRLFIGKWKRANGLRLSFTEERSRRKASKEEHGIFKEQQEMEQAVWVVRGGVSLEANTSCGLLLRLEEIWNLWKQVKQVGDPITVSYFKGLSCCSLEKTLGKRKKCPQFRKRLLPCSRGGEARSNGGRGRGGEAKMETSK